MNSLGFWWRRGLLEDGWVIFWSFPVEVYVDDKLEMMEMSTFFVRYRNDKDPTTTDDDVVVACALNDKDDDGDEAEGEDEGAESEGEEEGAEDGVGTDPVGTEPIIPVRSDSEHLTEFPHNFKRDKDAEAEYGAKGVIPQASPAPVGCLADKGKKLSSDVLTFCTDKKTLESFNDPLKNQELVTIKRWLLRMHLQKAAFRASLEGQDIDGDGTVRWYECGVDSLRIWLTWLELFGVLVVLAQVILRILTATTVFPKKYKSTFSFFWTSPLFLLDVLVIIPATLWNVINRLSFQTAAKSEGVVIGLASPEVAFLLFRTIDVADAYLTYRGNTGMMLLWKILASVWPVLTVSLMVFLTLWVGIAALYFLFDNREAWLHNELADEDFLGEGNFFQTKFSSIPAAMYHVFINFNGEFPLGDQHRTVGSKFAALLAMIVGVGVIGIPTGLVGNTLEDAWGEEGIESSDPRGSVEDEDGEEKEQHLSALLGLGGAGAGDDGDDKDEGDGGGGADGAGAGGHGGGGRGGGGEGRDKTGRDTRPAGRGVSASGLLPTGAGPGGSADALMTSATPNKKGGRSWTSTPGSRRGGSSKPKASFIKNPEGYLDDEDLEDPPPKSSLNRKASMAAPAPRLTSRPSGAAPAGGADGASPDDDDHDSDDDNNVKRIVKAQKALDHQVLDPHLAADFAALDDDELEQVANNIRRPTHFKVMAARSRAKSVKIRSPTASFEDDDLSISSTISADSEDEEFPRTSLRETVIGNIVGKRKQRHGCFAFLAALLNNQWFFLVLEFVTVSSIVAFLVFNYFAGKALYDPEGPDGGEEGDMNIRKYVKTSPKYFDTAHPTATFELGADGKVKLSPRTDKEFRLHIEFGTVFTITLIFELAATLYFLAEYVARCVDNNHFRRLLDIAIATAMGEKWKAPKLHYCFTWWGIADLLSWLPTLVMFLLFLGDSVSNRNVRCLPVGSGTIKELGLEGSALADRTGCVDFSAWWIAILYGLGVSVRMFKFERRLRAFEVVRQLAGHFGQM